MGMGVGNVRYSLLVTYQPTRVPTTGKLSYIKERLLPQFPSFVFLHHDPSSALRIHIMPSAYFPSSPSPFIPADCESIQTNHSSHENFGLMFNTTYIHNTLSPAEEQCFPPSNPGDDNASFIHQQSTSAGINSHDYNFNDLLEAFTTEASEVDTPLFVRDGTVGGADCTTSDSSGSLVPKEVRKDAMNIPAESTEGTSATHCSCSQMKQELKEIRAVLAQIQSGLPRKYPSSDSLGLGSGIKRGSRSVIRRLTQRKHRQRNVNFRVVRARLRVDGQKQTREYLRMRKYGDRRHCWTTDIHGITEEVDGEYLLSFSTELALEVRANGDWLPLEVRWDEKSQQFKSVEGIDGNTLCITDAEMIAAMTEGTSSYTAHVSWR